MQHTLPISNDPDFGAKRTDLVGQFIWNIDSDNIKVSNRIYYTKLNGDFASKPEPFDKTLTVDNTDFINTDTGSLVLGEEYAATTVKDPVSGANVNHTYPHVAGQYDVMVATSLQDYMEMISPGVKAKLAAAHITEFSMPLAQLLLGVIDINITISDQKGKFNV